MLNHLRDDMKEIKKTLDGSREEPRNMTLSGH